MRHYLIDGYNYLFRAGLLGPGEVPAGALEAARAALVRRLRPLQRDGSTVEIVLDAAGAHARGAGDRDDGALEPDLTFAVGESADDRILREVREAPRAAAITVVTDDRELAGRARHLGAKTTSVGEIEARVTVARSPRTRPARAADEADESRGRAGSTAHPGRRPRGGSTPAAGAPPADADRAPPTHPAAIEAEGRMLGFTPEELHRPIRLSRFDDARFDDEGPRPEA